MKTFVAVIGAGLTGLMAALRLAQRGYHVIVFEKRSLAELTAKRYTTKGQPGRSMSIDISARGKFALNAVDALDDIVAESIPMTHRIFHNLDGSIASFPYSTQEHEYIVTVSRLHIFNTLLTKCAGFANIELRLSCPLTNIDFANRSITILDSASGQQQTLYPSVVLGADGLNSVVRAFIEKDAGDFSISSFPMSYKELSIPPSGAHNFSINATHKWARKNAMLVAQPNNDGSFMCALLLAEQGQSISFDAIANPDVARKFFDDQFPDASTLMTDLEAEYQTNPVCRMRFVKGKYWSRDNFALLIGDAAHAMMPFFGQGINCCFEDCTFLAQRLDRYGNDWQAIINDFDQVRVHEANAINKMSYENYPELFDFTDLNKNLLKRKIEAELMQRYQDFRSYHNLVCFDQVPYTLAQRVKDIQSRLVDRLCRRVERIDDLESSLLDLEFANYQRELTDMGEHSS